ITTDDPELLEMAAELLSGQINGCEIPMTNFGEIGFLGPYAFDILGTEERPDGLHRGPFEARAPATPGVRPRYHSLWNHNHKLEQSLERRGAWTHNLAPRKYHSARLQAENRKRLGKIWKLRSHIHWNQDFQFNSQATSCIHTATATLGGNAWPGCQFHDKNHAIPFLLWMNSTLGMLAYWHQSSRQQSGRGRIAFKAAALVPVFDFRTLRKRQIEKATALFKELKRNPMRPLNEIDEDENRKLLDERFYREVLNLPAELHEPGGFLETLRAKLAREPSIQGGKRPK
ncbi:MAG: hypothetical protein OXU78_09425, partial [Deltaproteobacteria bacterium]|nr:hypothetical protein [Deltaproteobacteria bacterium]